MGDLAARMAQAIRSGGTLPNMPAGLDLDAAYALQKDVVAAVAGGAIAGLKAGMTTASARQRFGLEHALIGSLYAAGRLASGAVFASAPGVVLECELGLIVDADGAVRAAVPVVEVPRIAFAAPEDATAANFAACNIAADRFIVGSAQPPDAACGDIRIALSHDGAAVASGAASEAFGGPRQALAWMLGEAARRELAIADGMLLITGACGGVHDALPGRYAADYGRLGRIEFTVE